jgi:hypothetical protein
MILYCKDLFFLVFKCKISWTTSMPIIAVTASNYTNVNPLFLILHIQIYNKNSTISSTKNTFVRMELLHH